MKNKFRLSALYRAKGNALSEKISHLIRQYFSLPLIHSAEMKPQLERLEREVKNLLPNLTQSVGERLNAFHAYIIRFWMQLLGNQTLSVVGAPHKTNNMIER